MEPQATAYRACESSTTNLLFSVLFGPWYLSAEILIRRHISDAVSPDSKDRNKQKTKPLAPNDRSASLAGISRAVEDTSDAVENDVVTGRCRRRRVNTRLTEAW